MGNPERTIMKHCIRQLYGYHAWCVLTNRKHRVVTKTFAVEQDRDYVAEALSVNTGDIRVLWQIRLGDGRALFQTPIEIPRMNSAHIPAHNSLGQRPYGWPDRQSPWKLCSPPESILAGGGSVSR
jgi:hypothetical protein